MAFVVSANKPSTGFMTPTPDNDGSNGFEREEIIAGVLAVFESNTARGVIIVGEYGVGKTFVARHVVEALGSGSLVLSLRCSSITATMQYGALSPILNDLGEVSLENPLVVLRDISKSLKERAKGRQIVFFVDNIQSLDDHTAMILAQLAASGTAHILGACDSLSSAPSELVGLWRDGLIRRVDLTAFSEQETRRWIGSMLGAPVTASAARALWTLGGGNPRYLEAILQEQLEAGTLVLRDGTWVVTGAPFVCGHNSIDTVMTAFGSVSLSERKVVELLALSGGLPLSKLMGLCDVAAIDSLQQRGYLVISRAEFAMVRLANRLMAQVLRQHVPSGRRRELYELVMSGAGESSGQKDFDMVVWALDCGVPLELDRAIRASRAACDSGFPSEALRILESIPRPINTVAAVETARALLLMGEISRARSVIFGAGLDNKDLTLAQWTELMLMRNTLSANQGADEFVPRDFLAQIRLRLDAVADGSDTSMPHPGTEVFEGLRQDLMMGQIEERMNSGRYFEIASDLERIFHDGLSSKMRLKAGNWLLGTWILTGRVDDAFELAEQIGFNDLLEEVGTGEPKLSDSALIFAVVASLVTEETGANYDCLPAGLFASARNTAFAELSTGLVHAYNGRAERALEYLLPAASQLDQLGESGAGSLASAAAGYAFALKGEDDASLQHLNKKRSNVGTSSRIVQASTAYFNILATAELASKEKAIVRLLALAEDERHFRNTFVELVILQAAVRLGNTSSSGRLKLVAGTVQGNLARICESFGQGLQTNDVVVLLRVAEAAANIGDDLLSRDVARAALKIANEQGDKEGSRLAQQLIRGGVLKLGRVKISTEDGRVLTHREQEIASHAASGESNKAIAARMHISVRTVEGHLYQVYAKLQVTSRAELRETLA